MAPIAFKFNPNPESEVAKTQVQPEAAATEEEPDVHFEPVVQLDEVEVKSGEESESMLFVHRAKVIEKNNKFLRRLLVLHIYHDAQGKKQFFAIKRMRIFLNPGIINFQIL